MGMRSYWMEKKLLKKNFFYTLHSRACVFVRERARFVIGFQGVEQLLAIGNLALNGFEKMC